MAKDLNDFMKAGFDQINWPDDGVIKIQYLGQEIVDTNFGDRVKLACFDLIELKETQIYTSSGRLLRKLFKDLKIETNDKIAIKREGIGSATKYEAKIIEKANPENADKKTAPEEAKPVITAKTADQKDPF